ncbi:oxysterol-binding protein-related protein 9 [Nematostella vectensis]|uniref:oxysterol-binding protein-related protein 9 n=1 Tax=Nematostella vectensis TaxID=45351 RepID=UPI00207732A5|nr:oxysterol-binding protein-related protein 9 [Nematostella vectensis]
MAVVMEGPLSKWTNVVKGWQYRWFVLDDNTGLLSYYTSKEKMMRGARRGCLRLKGANLGIDDEDDSTFTISCDQKTFHFQARDAEERERWIRALEDTIKRHSLIRKQRAAMVHEIEFDPMKENLDQRLAEAEAYYKILSKQIKVIQGKLIPESAQTQRYASIKESSQKMLDSVGECINRMNSTKMECEKCIKTVAQETESMLPIVPDHYSNSRQEQSNNPNPTSISDNNVDDILIDKLSIRPSKSESSLSPSPTSTTVTAGGLSLSRVTSKSSFELTTPTSDVIATESFETLASLSGPKSIPNATPGGTYPSQVYSRSPSIARDQVPFASYSSSDEEDVEFFDADEFHEHSGERSEDDNSADLLLPIQKAAVLLNEDDYEPEESNVFGKELGADAVEQHSSVITHLLSQVRLGMDLTKVVLPTFILERRSLLEMYADFFAHPDLFSGIVDQPTPRDRMVQVVRWYLSAFHAGRKGSIAKKPYNPILGETFRCFWVLPEFASTRSQESLEEGPVPWAANEDVTFIAEQVSHHPPISAFYAENRAKSISFGAHIWTKSKFLGLSVGVENVGQGCVSVLPFDEEYIVTFPNGYGRSILTVPWMEIGGKVAITCAKTGYSATVQFHCKPFYGGKKHRISCEVMAPSEKKPFLTIQGEWNGQMYAKFADDEEETLFIDTKTLPITQKMVKRIQKQEEFESRRLWQDVTINLKKGDVDKATEAKHKLEERQRGEARERKELGTNWETKLFHEVGGHWVYDKLLQK